VCTLTLCWRVFPDAPIVVAANRDEDVLRPFLDPALWPDELAGIFAGRDLTGGGTWLGVNRLGVFCGLTNRWEGGDARPGRRSRGLLVLDALRAASATEAAHHLSRIIPAETNPFGILLADRETAFRVDLAAGLSIHPLNPGLAVLANWGPAEKRARTERAHELAASVPVRDFESSIPAFENLLSDHEGADEPGRAICVHGDRYATVCSTILAIGEAGIRWRDLRGNPCSGSWYERALGRVS